MDINWKTTEQADIGVNFGLFGGLLHGTIDVFNRDTKDMLMEVTPPAHVGSVKYLGGSSMGCTTKFPVKQPS